MDSSRPSCYRPESLLDQVHNDAVLEHLEHLDQEIFAPAHQPVEVLSAIAHLLRADEITAETAGAAIRDAGRLVQELVVPDAALIWQAYQLRDRIRVVDGLDVALAQRLGCPLVTTDRRLAPSHPPCDILLASLGE